MGIEVYLLDDDEVALIFQENAALRKSLRELVDAAKGKTYEMVELDDETGEIRSAIDEA